MEGFLNPSEVLKELKLREEMSAADFGSGSGGWVIPLAKQLEGGKVYAVDILGEPLSALKAKLSLEKITNVQLVSADVEKGTDIFEDSCDLVLMTNLLFEVSDKKKVLEEGKRILKKGGRILVVDWKESAPLGPKTGRVSPQEVKNIALDLNLRIEKEFDAGSFHFGLILVK
jgi:ubiquinone/menaquinone biosynthesis C-methylase UbiE